MTDPARPTGDRTGPPVVPMTRRRALRPVPGRIPAVSVVLGVLVGVGLVSAAFPAAGPPPAPSNGDGLILAPAGSHASTLFCVPGTGAGATSIVYLANPSPVAVRGVLTAVGTSGGPVRRPVTVPGRGTAAVTPGDGLPPGPVAASFAFAGGGVAGQMVVADPAGWSTAPCTSTVAPQWDFAGGSTVSGSAVTLALYDPAAAPATVDVTFLTPAGVLLTPQAYQGLTVGPGQYVTANLGDYVQNQPVVATLVQAVSGGLVATELQQASVPSGSGLALRTGVPAASATWSLAQTTVTSGGAVALDLANPGPAPVTATVQVGLTSASAAPQEVSVPAQAVVALAVSGVAGWPQGVPYTVTVQGTGPLVVGRAVAAAPGAPAPQWGSSSAVSTPATAWLVTGPGQPGNAPLAGAGAQSLAVADPGGTSAHVTVTALDGGMAPVRLTVAPHTAAVLGASRLGGLRPLVVTSSAPVTVELDASPSGAPGVVSTNGVPLVG